MEIIKIQENQYSFYLVCCAPQLLSVQIIVLKESAKEKFNFCHRLHLPLYHSKPVSHSIFHRTLKDIHGLSFFFFMESIDFFSME